MIVGQGSVNDTSSLLTTAQGKGRMWLKNHGTNTAYVGPSGVATGTGFRLDSGDSVEIGVAMGEVIHAVCAAAETATVSYALSWVY